MGHKVEYLDLMYPTEDVDILKFIIVLIIIV